MIVYGKNPVFEAIKAGKASRVYIRKGTMLQDVTFTIPVTVMQKPEFDGRFNREAQGIAAEVEDILPISFHDAREALKEAKGVLILDRIQDPHNYGAIIRSAHCFGVNHIIVPRYHQAPITPAVCKASAGAIFYTTIIEETNLSNVCNLLKELDYTIAACDMDAPISMKDYKAKSKTALVIGAEGKGVRDGLANSADELVYIPMAGSIDSLNAAQSAAIALYELFA
ncbi:MAG: 23S rRNA (guanosine(2251)-2'-O)-methyltransferase RlmB [Deferribacteraceae bacterium]|jgi:23S rRNA (guanosine2251-2'-O)-methyltransferase|nr:23S rRNA (guanosine(2251)-2'-O)-methyltransferase RlmB [Deferribacteraceae bacterium]